MRKIVKWATLGVAGAAAIVIGIVVLDVGGALINFWIPGELRVPKEFCKKLRAAPPPPRRPVADAECVARAFKTVAGLIAEHRKVKPGKVTPASVIGCDFDANDFGLVELVMAFEEKFEVEISDADVMTLPTVADVANFACLYGKRLPR